MLSPTNYCLEIGEIVTISGLWAAIPVALRRARPGK
jgi:hypothetical protein